MVLINTVAQITLISLLPTKFKQEIPYNLRRVTECKIEDKHLFFFVHLFLFYTSVHLNHFFYIPHIKDARQYFSFSV